MATTGNADALHGMQSQAEFSLKHLVRQLAGQLGPRPADCPPREILMDIEIDGARYVLIRARPDPVKVFLSPREREIARMVAEGCPNKVIADVLDISAWTVCTHLRRIFGKLGVRSRAAMVSRMVETGVLPRSESGPDAAARGAGQ